MLAVDHVIVAVRGLDPAGERFYEEYGLASVAGGRHPGHGTANRIVPLGGSYIELMAVVDREEAAGNPLTSWLERRLEEIGESPAALCLRTDDLEAVARLTGHRPVPMSRTRPDGVELTWRLVGLDTALSEGLPFFIEWHIDDAHHPARTVVDHRVTPTGVEWVELGGDGTRLAEWLGPHGHQLPLRHVDGRPGPIRIGIAQDGGEPIVIG